MHFVRSGCVDVHRVHMILYPSSEFNRSHVFIFNPFIKKSVLLSVDRASQTNRELSSTHVEVLTHATLLPCQIS